jgi:hypothetical protein
MNDLEFKERKEKLYDCINEDIDIKKEMEPKIEDLEATISHLKRLEEDARKSWEIADMNIRDYQLQLLEMGVDVGVDEKDFEDYINSKSKEKLPF